MVFGVPIIRMSLALDFRSQSTLFGGPIGATKGPVWGYPRLVLGAVDPLLEPFRGRLSPNIDNVSEN